MRNAGRWMIAAFVGLLAACSSHPAPNTEPDEGKLEIVSFQAAPTTIAPGGSTILSWAIKNAATVQIFGSGVEALFEGSKLHDSVEVSPTETTTYRLEARNAAGDRQEREVTVEVEESTGPAVTFSVEPTRIAYGDSAKLRWTTTDAVRVVISEGSGSPILDSDKEADSLSRDFDVSPDNTTVYELEATARDGSQTRASAELIINPVILSFGSDQTSPVTVGTDIELQWTTSGAEALIITTPEGQSYDVPAEDRASGEARLSVDSSGRFALKAIRGKGEATMEYVVGIVDQPRIIALSATPEAVTFGATHVDVTVQWAVEEATSITLERVPAGAPIDLTGITVDAGSVVVSVSAATTLVFKATNGAAEITRELVIPVVLPPLILSFGATSSEITADEPFTLSWTTFGASALELKRDDVPVSIGQEAVGSVVQTLSEGATYVLTATNLAGTSISQTREIPVGPPAVTSFTALPSRISQGEEIVFSWQVRNSPAGITPTLTIQDEDGIELVLPELADHRNGGTASITLDVPGAHNFTLRAATPGTFDSVATAAVRVIPRPVIATLTATPDTLTTGQTTIAWTTQFADSATLWEITESGPAQPLHTFSGADAQSGSFTLTPSVSSGIATYRLVARNELEAEVEASVDVNVMYGPIRLFNVSHSSIRARDPVTIQWITSGGAATLSPFVDQNPTELTPAAPFTDISSTGTPIDLDNPCVGQSAPLNEGCATINFPGGFTFPFDGEQRAEVDVYVNGFLSFDIGKFSVGSTGGSHLHFPTPPDWRYAHIAPYWSNLTLHLNHDAGIYYELRDGPKGEHLIIQWHRASELFYYWLDSDLNMQVTLWPNGAFDFSYGSMRVGISDDFDAYPGLLGYQGTTGTHSHMHPDGQGGYFVPGIQHRSWRYFEKPQMASGSTIIRLYNTTILTLCVDLPTHRECQNRTVVVD